MLWVLGNSIWSADEEGLDELLGSLLRMKARVLIIRDVAVKQDCRYSKTLYGPSLATVGRSPTVPAQASSYRTIPYLYAG